MTPSYSLVLSEVTSLLTNLLESETLDGRLADAAVESVLRDAGRVLTQHLLEKAAAEAVRKWTTDSELNGGGYQWERTPLIGVSTLYGLVTLPSPYLRIAKKRRDGGPVGIRPVFEELGLKGRSRTLTLERRVVDFGIDDSYDAASRKLQEHYGLELSGESVRRVTEKHAGAVYVASLMEELDGAFPPPSLLGPTDVEGPFLVEMDGSCVRTGYLQPKETEELTPVRGLPKRARVTEWRDTRLAFIRPLAEQDERQYAGGTDPLQDVLHRLRFKAYGMGWRSGVDTTCVSDGGAGLMERMTTIFEGSRHILDRPHLVEHLHEVAKEKGLSETEAKVWVAEQMDDVDEGRAEKTIHRLKLEEGPGQERAIQCAGYLKRFRASINYGAFKEMGLPIGSGEIESAHKSQVQCRLKLPGATWNVRSVDRILAMRLRRSNGGWADYWKPGVAA